MAIGSLVQSSVQRDGFMTSSAPNDNDGSGADFGVLNTDSSICRIRCQYGPRKHAHNYDTHRLEIPPISSADNVTSKLTEFVALIWRVEGEFEPRAPTRMAAAVRNSKSED